MAESREKPFPEEPSGRLEFVQPANTDADLLPVVNERDEPIGALPRRQVHLERHRHRAVQVCVFAADGRIWLQRRSLAKDTWPGAWDWACTGHVDAGESYDEAARRELREELGIEAEPVYIGRHPASAETGWEFQILYALRWAGPILPDPDEILELRAFTPETLASLLAADAGAGRQDPAFVLTPGVHAGWPLLRAARWFSAVSDSHSDNMGSAPAEERS